MREKKNHSKRINEIQALRESEEIFSKHFFSSPIATAITAIPDGKVIKVNQAFSDLTGYSMKETIGKSTGELNIWADPSEHNEVIKIIHEKGRIHDFENRIRRKSGDVVYCLSSAEIVKLNNIPHIISWAVDITARKKVEEELIKEKDKAENYLNIAGTIIVALDYNGNIVLLYC